jgi:hypothetical protein
LRQAATHVCPFLDDDVLWTLAVDTVVVNPDLTSETLEHLRLLRTGG